MLKIMTEMTLVSPNSPVIDQLGEAFRASPTNAVNLHLYLWPHGGY